MARFVPDWPALMNKRTVASYLDLAREDGNLKREFKEWRDMPGFPKPDPDTGLFYRPAIDAFLAVHFGYADPLQADKQALDKEFAGS
ncbi:hypothetical protein HBA54_03095 [Pelagibius litoralis]|uniref:Uncharacterized protein n=1 Tax=Pelagibius litoralis TaxID=374515 RepID=A0A967C217_9PROT|nr:hypothetical protein [Pelagibius litoralis]NIA67568.1 hypothetical protein [Pelagibius litoralis]